MKLKSHINRRFREAFTLVEVLVALLVFSIFSTGILLIYRFSVHSYKATSWKQDRTHQAELFWNVLRKSVEEATDELKPLSGLGGTIDKIPMPLLYKDSSDSTHQGGLLAWKVYHLNNAGGLDYNNTYLVELKNRSLVMTVKPDPPGWTSPKILLEDVDCVKIQATPIWRSTDPGKEEFLGTAGPDSSYTENAGSVIEISITLTPPQNVSIPDLKIIQNNKFKLIVGSVSSSSPSY